VHYRLIGLLSLLFRRHRQWLMSIGSWQRKQCGEQRYYFVCRQVMLPECFFQFAEALLRGVIRVKPQLALQQIDNRVGSAVLVVWRTTAFQTAMTFLCGV